MRKIAFYSYREIAALFNVKISTVRCWKWAGLFKILGYRRLNKGWGKKEAVVSEEEVKLLIHKKLIRPR